MKKITMFLMLTIGAMCVFGLVGCNDDDGPDATQLLTGTWEQTASEGWLRENGELIYKWDENESDTRFEFKQDGSFVEYLSEGSGWDIYAQGTWHCKNDLLRLHYPNEEGTEDDEVVDMRVYYITDYTLWLDYHYDVRAEKQHYVGFMRSAFQRITSSTPMPL